LPFFGQEFVKVKIGLQEVRSFSSIEDCFGIFDDRIKEWYQCKGNTLE